MSTREDILATAAPLPPIDVQVAEWGGRTVRVPQLDALERIELSDKLHDATHADGAEMTQRELHLNAARLVALLVVDPETGGLIFAESDAEALARHHWKAIKRLFDIATDLNGFGRKEAEAAAGKSLPAESAGMPTA